MALARALSSIALILLVFIGSASAHEVQPAIVDVEQDGAVLRISASLNLEGILAGIDLSKVSDTNAAPEAADYDALRALDPAALEERLRLEWPAIANAIDLKADGIALTETLIVVDIPDVGNAELPREAVLTLTADLPMTATTFTLGWEAAFGTMVLRQQGVEAPYTGYLEAGAVSDPIALIGGGQAGGWTTFFGYIPVGFDHIVPKGLDHILFVLGLFFLSMRMRPLLAQISAFTAAHTLTLGMAALGYVSVPASIVEPLIAASIVYVAIENTRSDGLSRWRPYIVFGFGLLHGLGFASVLGEFGLPQGAFFPALLGFNVGVELGQLFVIAIIFVLVGHWFGAKPWYRRVISTPASYGIALIGTWWFIERVFL